MEDKEIEEEIDSDVELEARGPSGKDEKRDSEDESEDEAEEEHRVTFASVNDLHRGCYVMMKGAFPCKVSNQGRVFCWGVVFFDQAQHLSIVIPSKYRFKR